MRTTITLDDKLVDDLREDTGIAEVSALVRTAMLEMRQRLDARAIAAMGGSAPDAWAPNEGDEPPV
jgi:Bacterial antitoxin of type II TA system, VapB